jgi:hypothetical protein
MFYLTIYWTFFLDTHLSAWLHLCQYLMDVYLSDETDIFIWNLTKNGVFNVKSMYPDLMNKDAQFLHKYL